MILLAVRIQSIILKKAYDFHSIGVLVYDTLFRTLPWDPTLKNLLRKGGNTIPWVTCAMPSIVTPRYKLVFLIVLVTLFLLQRSGLLWFGYSHISHPGFDETASGVLTCDLLTGALKAPLFVYQYESRSGDSLLEGFLLVPFFKLFGRSLFSLKFLALCSAFLSLLCWIVLLKRYLGTGAACIFTALFAFSPLMFARLNLMGTIASHHLINPLMALQLILLFRIVERTSAPGKLWLWFGFGLLTGLGSYIFYTYIIFNAYCLLFLLFTSPRVLTLRRTLWFLGGCLAGFSPWFARMFYSPAGGNYLSTILKNLDFNFWVVIQNFLFNLPHSFGYSYPSRDMGIISPFFFLFLIVMGWVIVREVYRKRTGSVNRQFGKTVILSQPLLPGMFVLFFPLFFLLCLSLSPMKIGLFEYWPTIGFFGNFSVSDVYRYRWLYPLFPFYFAIIAVGASVVVQSATRGKLSSAGVLCLLGFFLLWGAGKGVSLYGKDDFKRIFYYKGYNYDQVASRFVLSGSVPVDAVEADQYARNFPEETRGEIYKSLGTRVALELAGDPRGDEKLAHFLEGIDPSFLNDFVYGVIQSVQKLTEKEFHPMKKVLTKMFPVSFYENWGYRNLGYRYFDLFLNREKILNEISPLEKKVFVKKLKQFKRQLSDSAVDVLWDTLMEKIEEVPVPYQPSVIRGMGKLVGAEMLFDPLGKPDYPLDSRLGERFTGDNFKDAFYQGVGAGFAETLSRFWRRLLLKDNPNDLLNYRMLDRDWKHCQHLMNRVSPLYAVQIKTGFFEELQRKTFNGPIRSYLYRKGDVPNV